MKFLAKIGGEGGPDAGEVPLIEVPPRVVEAIGQGKKRVKVNVSLKGHAYRSTIAVYGGRYYLPVNKQNFAASGARMGETAEISLERDDAPRRVEIPPALLRALANDARAHAAFERLSYTRRREHAEAVSAAKSVDTRDRRIARILDALRRARSP